jgi:hypothetical protein
MIFRRSGPLRARTQIRCKFFRNSQQARELEPGVVVELLNVEIIALGLPPSGSIATRLTRADGSTSMRLQTS